MQTLDNIEITRFNTDKGGVIPAQPGFTLVVIGIIAIVFNGLKFFALGILALGILLLLVKHGIEVNINNNQFRDYYSIFKMRWGKWKTIAAPDYLLISKSPKYYGAPVLKTMSTKNVIIYYDLDLITKGDRDVLLQRIADYQELLQLAKLVADDQKLKICEKVNNEYIWLN
ncbi:MAG: hypothetical protein WAT43_19605 [Chitinophagales bacterium]